MGDVFVCPADEGAARSYAMNLWASSLANYADSKYGSLFGGPNVREGSKTILVTEVYSVYLTPEGYSCLTTCGGPANETPGQRFGARSPAPASWGHASDVPKIRFVTTPTEITYMNHRRPADGGAGPEPKGRLNIGYCDGHVEMKRHGDLVDWSTGVSRFDSLWSPNDYAHEQLIGPLP